MSQPPSGCDTATATDADESLLQQQLETVRARKQTLQQKLLDMEQKTRTLLDEQNKQMEQLINELVKQEQLETSISEELISTPNEKMIEVKTEIDGEKPVLKIVDSWASGEVEQDCGDRQQCCAISADSIVLFACFVCGNKYLTMEECHSHWMAYHAAINTGSCGIDGTNSGSVIESGSTVSARVVRCKRKRVSKCDRDEDFVYCPSLVRRQKKKKLTSLIDLPREAVSDKLTVDVRNSTVNDKDSVSSSLGHAPAELGVEDDYAVVGKHQCSQCYKSFKNASNLRRHERLHSGERPYLCPDCGQTFRVVDNLTLHLRTHSAARPFTCPYCDATYRRKDKLRTHILTKHEPQKLLACALCDRRFVAPYELRDHLRVHRDERPFDCDMCAKSFHSKIKLDCHRRQTHHVAQLSGTTPGAQNELECHECGKVMSCKASLTVHMRRHAGIYPYSCAQCQKCFASRAELTLHSQTHSTDRPFSCEICGALFKRRKTLSKHQQLHSSDRQFICKLCGLVFRTDSAMYLHRKRHHNNHEVGLQPQQQQQDDCCGTVAEQWQLTEVIVESTS